MEKNFFILISVTGSYILSIFIPVRWDRAEVVFELSRTSPPPRVRLLVTWSLLSLLLFLLRNDLREDKMCPSGTSLLLPTRTLRFRMVSVSLHNIISWLQTSVWRTKGRTVRTNDRHTPTRSKDCRDTESKELKFCSYYCQGGSIPTTLLPCLNNIDYTNFRRLMCQTHHLYSP